MAYIGRILATAMVAASLLDRTGFGQDTAADRRQPTTANASPAPADTTPGSQIRPFKVHVSEADVVDMRRRLAATRWPDKETVAILPLKEQPGK